MMDVSLPFNPARVYAQPCLQAPQLSGTSYDEFSYIHLGVTCAVALTALHHI